MDHVTNLRFTSDRNRHVCEIQFVHKTLLMVREGMGGHHVYNYFRSAMEMLETHGVFKVCSRRRNSSESDQTENRFLLGDRFLRKTGELMCLFAKSEKRGNGERNTDPSYNRTACTRIGCFFFIS